MVIQGGRLGATGIAVGIVAGLFTSIIFNLYSKLHVLEDSTSIPDFVVGWINYILPTLITLGLGMVLTKYCNFDIFEIVLWIFSPLAGFAQTMPGFILCCFIPAVLYSMGISSWLFGAVTTPIFLAGIQENINMVAQGLPATNIATSETVFTAALVTMGGMGATLALNVLMCFSKSKQLKTLGRIFIGPSIFNINEPIMFGAPVVFQSAADAANVAEFHRWTCYRLYCYEPWMAEHSGNTESGWTGACTGFHRYDYTGYAWYFMGSCIVCCLFCNLVPVLQGI